jgi:hypothetical protein
MPGINFALQLKHTHKVGVQQLSIEVRVRRVNYSQKYLALVH